MATRRPFTSAERWLFECLRVGEDDASIGRRMGIEAGEVSRWVARLAVELRVEGREGLVAIAHEELEGRTLPEEARAVDEAPPAGARYRRRALLAGGVVAFAAGAYGASRLSSGVQLLGAPGPTPTPTATSTPGPTATPAPVDIVQVIEPLQVQRTEFGPGQPIGIQGVSSIGYMDTAEGSATVWTATGARGFGLNAIFRPLDDPLDLVHMVDIGGFGPGSGPRDGVLQLSQDRGWTWTDGSVGFSNFAAPYLFLREHRGAAGPPLMHVLEPGEEGLQLVATLDLFERGTAEEQAYLGQLAVSADGRRLYELSFRSEPPELVAIDLPGGRQEVLTALERPDPSSIPRVLAFRPAGDGAELDVRWYVYTPDSATPVGAERYRIGGDGSVRTESLPVPAEGRVSPNGRYVVRDAPLRNVPSMQGVGESFPALVVSDALSDEPLFRVRSAMVDYGHRVSFVAGPEGQPRWLADSSGFVARISAAEPTEPRNAIIGPEGALLEMLPPPPEVVNEGRTRYVHGFVPSPDDPALLSWSGLALYDREERTWLALQPAAGSGGSNADPWLGTGERMVFSLSRGSFGSGAGLEQGVFLETSIEYPPFPEGDDALAFVTGGPEPVTLWSGLTTAREVVAELAPGTSLHTLDRPQGEVSPGRRATGFFNSEMHISVQTADGLTGWVAAADLRWA